MDWVRLFGIPLHIWRKETLEKLGEMVGVVEEVDDRCLQLEVVEFARMKIIHPVDAEIAKTCGWTLGMFGSVYGQKLSLGTVSVEEFAA